MDRAMLPYSSNLFLSCTILTFLLFSAGPTTLALIKLPAGEVVPAVLVFGDSIVDTGNNNDLASPARSNFPPYGRDFNGGVPTGRFSNGKVPSDFLVEELGIKDTLPAYKDPNLKAEDLLTGVCFASGGVGYDDLSSQTASVPPLSEQLREFKEYVNRVKGMIGEEGTTKLLANSLVIIVLSSNDIANTYFNARIRELQYDFPTYADILVNTASTFVMDLYTIGCRRIGVFGAPPLGCIPSSRTLAGGIERKCSEKYNQASQLFNAKLAVALNAMKANLDTNTRIVYIDIYSPLLDLIINYRSYGFEIANKGCCGTGKLEASVLCNKYNPFTCADDSKYLFWDGYHPSEKTYKILVNQLLTKYVDSFM
ncbi:GDSL esterase/lipase EXL1 [Linum grandiflorum]